MFAPPVRRGDFSYSSVLYADPGHSNPHPRASVTELAARLRPEAPVLVASKSHRAAVPAKDPAWHFYAAQLIHYGLPVSREKNTAKVRLLSALNQFKLEVPAWILGVESELKKEWESENRKMKKRAAGGANEDTPAASERAVKRKDTGKKTASDPIQSISGGVNVTVNLFSPAQQTSRAPGAQQYSPTSSTPKKSAKRKNESAAPSRSSKKALVATRSPPSIKQEHGLFSTSSSSQDYSSRQAAQSPYVPSPRIKSEPQRARRSAPPTFILFSGLYDITCSAASDRYGAHDLDLSLSRCPFRRTWWATFRWGAWDGIIRLETGPHVDALGQPCALRWRLRDLETQRLYFERELCTGEMAFFEDETVEGVLYNVPDAGTVEFNGRRLRGPGVQDDLQDEWEGFLKEAYGR